MTRRVLLLCSSLLLILGLVFAVLASGQHAAETNQLTAAVHDGRIDSVRGWLVRHQASRDAGWYKEAIIGAATEATTYDDAGEFVNNEQTRTAILVLLADSRSNPRDEISNALFVQAAELDCVPVVKRLLARGIDPNCRDQGGWPALVRASEAANIPMIQLLLQHGADPNIQFDYGHPFGNHLTILRYLRARSNLKEPNTVDETPKYAPIIRLLKANGARE